METSNQNFHIPEEIFLEILVKLPPKSIFRFKCVSKNWLSLISHPSFFPFYVSRSTASPPFKLIFDSYRGMHGFVSIGNVLNTFTSPFPSDHIQGLKIEATSNDLILCRSNCPESVYFLANFVTKQFVKLPMHSRKKNLSSTGLISYAENGITSYKVVRIIEYRHKNGLNSLNFETFSSDKGEWTIFKTKNCIFNVELDERPSIMFKGVINWICNKMTTLLSYDPFRNPEKCRFISIPNEAYDMNGMNAILGVSSENIYYFEMSRISIQDYNTPGWKLWMLKDYENGEWSLVREGKETRIESFGVFGNLLSAYSPLLPVAFHPWNEDVVYFWYEGFLLTFNVKTGWFEDKFSTFNYEGVVQTRKIFPLLMPFCSTHIPVL